MKALVTFALSLLFASSALALELADYELDTPIPVQDIKFIDEQRTINTLNDFKGKVVLLNFWATWCKPCVDEMPALSKLQASVEGRNIKILPLSLDYEGIEAVTAFYKELGIINLTPYLDRKGEAFKAYKLEALPTSIIINRKGMEVARIMGQIDWTSKEVRDYLIALSKE